MTRTALFLAGTAVLSFASPAAAQSMDHSSMPGMTMPVEPKKPVAETVPVPQPPSEAAPMPEMDHGNKPGMEMNQADTRPPADRNSDGWGKSVSVRVDRVGPGIINKRTY